MLGVGYAATVLRFNSIPASSKPYFQLKTIHKIFKF